MTGIPSPRDSLSPRPQDSAAFFEEVAGQATDLFRDQLQEVSERGLERNAKADFEPKLAIFRDELLNEFARPVIESINRNTVTLRSFPVGALETNDNVESPYDFGETKSGFIVVTKPVVIGSLGAAQLAVKAEAIRSITGTDDMIEVVDGIEVIPFIIDTSRRDIQDTDPAHVDQNALGRLWAENYTYRQKDPTMPIQNFRIRRNGFGIVMGAGDRNKSEIDFTEDVVPLDDFIYAPELPEYQGNWQELTALQRGNIVAKVRQLGIIRDPIYLAIDSLIGLMANKQTVKHQPLASLDVIEALKKAAGIRALIDESPQTSI